MTRHELNNELTKIERYIEIYKTLITDSFCDCFTQIQDKYIELNKSELAFLLRRKKRLMPLRDTSDEVLETISYVPIQIPC